MKPRSAIVALLLIVCTARLAIAQSGMDTAAGEEPYVPRLGDIMNAAQAQHQKLYLAGKARNWGLAAFELRQLKASVVEAAVLYSGIPVSNVTTMSEPLQSVETAIKAKDGRSFASAFAGLTEGCNSCHQSMKRGFIVMRVPTEQPFGNQVFAPQDKK